MEPKLQTGYAVNHNEHVIGLNHRTVQKMCGSMQPRFPNYYRPIKMKLMTRISFTMDIKYPSNNHLE